MKHTYQRSFNIKMSTILRDMFKETIIIAIIL